MKKSSRATHSVVNAMEAMDKMINNTVDPNLDPHSTLTQSRYVTSEEQPGDFFRIKLMQEWDDRRKTNQAFSLRAYARFLSIDPSSLSAILKGKRGVPQSAVERICERLRLNEKEAKLFRESARFQKVSLRSLADLESEDQANDQSNGSFENTHLEKLDGHIFVPQEKEHRVNQLVCEFFKKLEYVLGSPDGKSSEDGTWVRVKSSKNQ